MTTTNEYQKFCGVSMRPLSLVTLAVQNSFLILLMRYSRTLPGPLYLSTSAVLVSECMKLAICVGVFVYLELQQQQQQQQDYELVSSQQSKKKQSALQLVKEWLNRILLAREAEAWKLAIPATLYTLQNNLQYVAVSNLDAATFQVTYQLKILTTAMFSVLMLSKKLTRVQWVSLCLLTTGVAIVQLTSDSVSVKTSNSASKGSKFVGLVAVLTACCLSGLAGVYFEKILKKQTTAPNTPIIDGQPTAPVVRPPPSIWERNIQLAIFSIGFALVGCYTKDGDKIAHGNGLLQNFNATTWLVITTQATGGLLVAMVVKYADNILKGFATSVSIIISCVISVLLFPDTTDTGAAFIIGSFFVIYATWLYDSALSKGAVKNDAFLRGWVPDLPSLFSGGGK